MAQARNGSAVVVVGGGLAGLTAATLLARGGARVTLLEKAAALGGRARTQRRGEFALNQGPHALYVGGAARRVLGELGVAARGAKPTAAGFAIAGGRKHTMPGGLVSLLTTRLFALPAKLEVAQLLAGLAKIDVAPLARVPVDEWIRTTATHARVRDLLRALVRLSTYADAPEQSAGAAVANLQSALRHGVEYLDGGWQSLVDPLRAAAEAAGVRIETGRAARAVRHDGAVHAVVTDDGELSCGAVVVAGGPADVTALVPALAAGPIGRFAATATPVRAACLDLALSRLPQPKATFALGVDVPLYLSVHSAVARLAPPGGALIHAAKYLPVGRDADAAADQAELERLVDLVQPGWRDAVVERRLLPQMTVAHAVPAAAAGGLAGRPSAAVGEVAGLWVAGDWVGDEGLLADASVASAAAAARGILVTLARATAA